MKRMVGLRSSSTLRRGTTRTILGFAVALTVQCGVVAQQPSTQPPNDKTTTHARQTPVPPPPSAKGRKKIGLVFEGGGALGLAHIGVIRWIEQHHVPVDYIAGTSMGGLVGGLYASGLSPDEIETFVRGIDW